MTNPNQKNPAEGIEIAVLGAWKRCPECEYMLQEGIWQGCETCGKTGRVYALDPLGTIGVRVDCQRCKHSFGNDPLASEGPHQQLCSRCGGRRWVPTDDAWVLLEALWVLKEGQETWPYDGYIRPLVRGDKEEFFVEVGRFLVSSGFNLLEVE